MIQKELGRGLGNGNQIGIQKGWERNTSDRREGYTIIGTKK
jgi:hypothetical protein